MRKRRQHGATTVEFAFIGALAMLVLFAVIEFGRAVFVINMLGEVTRRGARFATVCPINDPAIAEVAVLNAPGGGAASPFIRELDTSQIAVEYLGSDGTLIGDPAGNFNNIRYVRVRVEGYQHRMLIPFFNRILTTPDFVTTLPRESLGVPRTGAVVPC